MDEKNLLRTYPGDMNEKQLEYARRRIQEDDQFRKDWRASTDYGSLAQMPDSKPAYSYQAEVENRAKRWKETPQEVHKQLDKEFSDTLSGKIDDRILKEVESMDFDELQKIASGTHAEQKLIEDKGGVTRLRQLLISTPNRNMSGKLSEIQRLFLTYDPIFAKAYKAADANLIPVNRPTYRLRQGSQ